MLTRFASFKKIFHWGFALSLLAMALVVSAPGLQALHSSACPHHSGTNHGVSALLKGHDTHTLAENLHSSGGSFLSVHGHTADYCPICQALGSLGQHFILHETIAIDRSAIAAAVGRPDSCEPLLSSPLNYSISPRAPPSLVA